MERDMRLAESVDGIDIILGGHDHCYEVKKVWWLINTTQSN